jgi:hypothetical protein
MHTRCVSQMLYILFSEYTRFVPSTQYFSSPSRGDYFHGKCYSCSLHKHDMFLGHNILVPEKTVCFFTQYYISPSRHDVSLRRNIFISWVAWYISRMQYFFYSSKRDVFFGGNTLIPKVSGVGFFHLILPPSKNKCLIFSTHFSYRYIDI